MPDPSGLRGKRAVSGFKIEVQAPKVSIVTGRLSARTGGPLATIGNLAKLFGSRGAPAELIYIAPEDEEVPVAPDAHHRRVSGLCPLPQSVWTAFRSSQLVIVVGVWHPAYAVALTCALLNPGTRLVLVPTNSLMPWDWAKHRCWKRLLAPLLWLTMRRVDAVVFASSGEMSQSRPRKIRRIFAIPHAVAAPPAPEEVAGTGPPSGLLFVGRLDRQKDIPLLLEAISQLGSDAPRLALVGAGEPEYVASLVVIAERLKVSTEWLGQRGREEVMRRMACARAVVVTSYAENFCHVAAEAASLGTPVVLVDRVASADDLGASPAIHLAPPTAEAIAQAVRSILSRRPPSSSERQEAAEFYRREWSSTAFGRRWQVVLQALGLGNLVPDTLE
jgi:glycosyltransferase involved in cell wall biosynthesis